MLVALIYPEWSNVLDHVSCVPDVVGNREGTQVAIFYFKWEEDIELFKEELQGSYDIKIKKDAENAEEFMLDVLAEEV